MANKRLVPFISDKRLIEAVELVVDATRTALSGADAKIDKNILDPFSALYDSALHGLTYEEWLRKERSRQVQKTMQNAIGGFHQKILGGIDGWEDLGTGNIVDIRNKNKKIIAEVKNKHNTVTGQHVIRIYDALTRALLLDEHKGFQGYYVAIVPKKKDTLKLFTPPDNATKQCRPPREDIKEISGWLFYDIATGEKGSLYTLFSALPKVLEVNFKCNTDAFKADAILKKIFNRTYPGAIK